MGMWVCMAYGWTLTGIFSKHYGRSPLYIIVILLANNSKWALHNITVLCPMSSLSEKICREASAKAARRLIFSTCSGRLMLPRESSDRTLYLGAQSGELHTSKWDYKQYISTRVGGVINDFHHLSSKHCFSSSPHFLLHHLLFGYSKHRE